MADPLVLLPAMMTDARLFSPLLPVLSRYGAVMVGHIGGAQRIEDLATHVLNAAPARFALAGVELGGMVAMEVIRRAPERVTRLALMDTTPLAESPQHAAAREPLIIAARTGRLAEVMADLRPASAFAPGTGRPQILDALRKMADDAGPEVFANQTRALQRRRDQQATLRRVGCPALVLSGQLDSVYPLRRHEVMADLIPPARLVTIQNAGHLALMAQPSKVLEALADWWLTP